MKVFKRVFEGCCALLTAFILFIAFIGLIFMLFYVNIDKIIGYLQV